MHLTKTFIEQVIPPIPGPDGKGRQAFYRDSDLTGFALRVASGGTKSYVLERRIRGKVKRITLGRCGEMELARARARAKKLIGEIERENTPRIINGKIADEQISLLAAFREYLVTHPGLNQMTRADYQRSMQGPLKDWQRLPVRELTEAMILTKHATQGQISKSRCNNAMRLLRAILNHVKLHLMTEQHTKIIKYNPVDILSHRQIWYPRQTRTSHSCIKSEQLKTWWQATLQVQKTSSRDYLHFLLLTGLPHVIVSKLTFDDVDYDNKIVRLGKDDTRNAVLKFPLSNYLINLLRDRAGQQSNSSSDYIFPGINKETPITDPRATVRRIQKMSDVHFTLNDLHRTFMTLAQQSDINQLALGLISRIFRKNHVSLTMQDINLMREIQERVFLTVFFIIGSIK